MELDMLKNIEKFMNRPKIYSLGTNKTFWTDEHISKFLLEAYLDQNTDASSRRIEFINQSVEWIAQIIPQTRYPKLLDLGCGAGLYAERFASLGYEVTGIDFSKRAINYGKEQSILSKSKIKYILGDYLTLDFGENFDVISLIYCDFGALSDKDRSILLQKVYTSLKPGGKFILDVFSLSVFLKKKESKTRDYHPDGGFWSSKPHLCLEANYLYDDDNTELRQSIVQTDTGTNCYNVWEHYYTRESFVAEIETVGLKNQNIYDDVAGKSLSDDSETLCGIFVK